jgi:hypothetical protein
MGSSQTMNGVQRQGAGDADALALAAGEFVRVAVGEAAVQADLVHQLVDAFQLLGLVQSVCSSSGSPMMLGQRHARVEAGLRVLEHHLHRRALACAAPRGQAWHVLAVDHHRPAVGSYSRSIARPTRWTCRSRIRRPGPGSRRRDVEGHAVHRLHVAGVLRNSPV